MTFFILIYYGYSFYFFIASKECVSVTAMRSARMASFLAHRTADGIQEERNKNVFFTFPIALICVFVFTLFLYNKAMTEVLFSHFTVNIQEKWQNKRKKWRFGIAELEILYIFAAIMTS